MIGGQVGEAVTLGRTASIKLVVRVGSGDGSGAVIVVPGVDASVGSGVDVGCWTGPDEILGCGEAIGGLMSRPPIGNLVFHGSA